MWLAVLGCVCNTYGQGVTSWPILPDGDMLHGLDSLQYVAFHQVNLRKQDMFPLGGKAGKEL